jgi:hypothetical protein
MRSNFPFQQAKSSAHSHFYARVRDQHQHPRSDVGLALAMRKASLASIKSNRLFSFVLNANFD